MPRDPIERNGLAGLAALVAIATAVIVLHVASARSGAESAAAEHGVEPHGMQPFVPTIDHAALSPSANAVGDAQTVEASIAAYER
jgi:hypothetical protein